MKTLKNYRIFIAPICIILLLGAAISISKASPKQQAETDFAAIDQYIATQMNELGIPGMALGVIQDGQIVHLQGFGTADSSGRTVTPQTPFHIGSVTKSFTALAVMQLVEEGKIDLDAPVETYLPWFELADKEAAARLTVRNLLNHATGISTKDGNEAFTSQEDLETRIRDLSSLKLSALVGERYQYSNLNYDIAGLIVEKVSGQSYADYVEEHIFQPLDMRHSYASEADALAGGVSEGHLFVLGRAMPVPRDMPPSHLPSGYLIASVEDLSQYAVAHLNDGRFGDVQILSAEGMNELHKPAIAKGPSNDYAMGWVVDPLDGVQILWHDGSEGRNYAVIILMPDSDSGIIILANAIGFAQNSQGPKIAQNVLHLFNSQPVVPISPPPGPTFLYWAIMLTPLLMVLGIIFIWRNWRYKGLPYAIPVALLYSGIPIMWLIVVPLLVQASIWSRLRVNIAQPELAAAMLVSAVLGIGWSIVYLLMNLKTQPRSVIEEKT